MKTYSFVNVRKLGKDKWEVNCLGPSGSTIQYIDRTPGKTKNDVIAWAKAWCEKQNLDDAATAEAAHVRYRRLMAIKFIMSGGKDVDLSYWDNVASQQEH